MTNGGSHAAPSSSRFVPHSFQYNGRVAMALLPSLAVLAGYGGNAVAAALAVSSSGRCRRRHRCQARRAWCVAAAQPFVPIPRCRPLCRRRWA